MRDRRWLPGEALLAALPVANGSLIGRIGREIPPLRERDRSGRVGGKRTAREDEHERDDHREGGDEAHCADMMPEMHPGTSGSPTAPKMCVQAPRPLAIGARVIARTIAG